VRRESGIELEIIEGIEEARLIQRAVARRLGLGDRLALLVDVGGGSTEVTLLEGGRATFSMSLSLGTVRLLETFLKGAKTLAADIERLLDEAIERALGEAIPHIGTKRIEIVVGTGGNVDTLAELCPAKVGPQGAERRAIDVNALGAFFKRIAKMTTPERRDTFNLRPDRADTIVPATAIFLQIAKRFGASAVLAPGVGLKEGILEELVDKHFRVWDAQSENEAIIDGCRRLGRRYQFDEAHGERVCKLAGELFDDLAGVHLFGDRERLLLRAAAMLHDIGDFVRYDGHHKHSYYLIQHSDVMGLTPDERAVVANIARYHRKSLPDLAHPNFRELDRDARGRVRGLAAILRIADALDREHRGKVHAVRAILEPVRHRVRLMLTGEKERELEEWTVRAKGEMLRDVYDLEVVLVSTDG
jgi:exopolyphosphatase/guanosine-5'-triphosphate,3'-diphosphate pyrophosphatase